MPIGVSILAKNRRSGSVLPGGPLKLTRLQVLHSQILRQGVATGAVVADHGSCLVPQTEAGPVQEMIDSAGSGDERAGEKAPDFVEGRAYQRRSAQQSFLSIAASAFPREAA
jgi:hypothetical protein